MQLMHDLELKDLGMLLSSMFICTSGSSLRNNKVANVFWVKLVKLRTYTNMILNYMLELFCPGNAGSILTMG